MVFQNYALYLQMAVAQNLGFSLEISGFPKSDIQSKGPIRRKSSA